MKARWLIMGIVILPLLAGCVTKPPAFEDRIETANQSVLIGTIQSLGKIDLYQEGTHQLQKENGDTILVQSSEINLNRYLGKLVEADGKMNQPKNQTPVFTVTAIRLQGKGADGEWEFYENKRAGIQFDYPTRWELSTAADQITFRLGGQTVVTIGIISTNASLEAFAKEREGRDGTPVTVAGVTAWRYAGGDTVHFYIPNPAKQKIMVLTFVPTEENPVEVTKWFYQFLETIVLTDQVKKSTGARCGGPAKLECPGNHRCELYSTDSDSAGVCVPLVELDEEPPCPFVAPPDCPNYEAASTNQNGCPTRYRCPFTPSP